MHLKRGYRGPLKIGSLPWSLALRTAPAPVRLSNIMKIFISQSQPRSQELAVALEAMLQRVVHGIDTWVSKTGTDQGVRWSSEIANHLKEAAAGIVVVTSENLNERWLLFEAGALSIKPVERLWTFLLDLKKTDVEQPLGAFQHTLAEKAETLKMVKSIHQKAVEADVKTNTKEQVEDLFSVFWDRDLGPKIEELRRRTPAGPTPARSTEQILTEILEQVRQSARVIDRSGWRQEKTLLMLHDVYRASLGSRAPSLAELKHRSKLPPSLHALSDLSVGTLGSLYSLANLGSNAPAAETKPLAVDPDSDSAAPNLRSEEDDPT
jgi:hypothetical protein